MSDIAALKNIAKIQIKIKTDHYQIRKSKIRNLKFKYTSPLERKLIETLLTTSRNILLPRNEPLYHPTYHYSMHTPFLLQLFYSYTLYIPYLYLIYTIIYRINKV